MRLLLVEDDAILGDGLARLLRDAGYAVDWVKTGRAAEASLGAEEPDVLVLDLELPDLDGIELLRRLRSRRSSVPVLILTARDSVPERVGGLDVGADDYLVKPFETAELLARVRALARRRHGGASSQVSVGALWLDFAARRARAGARSLELGARDWQLLELLAPQPGRIVGKEQMLRALCAWGEEITPNAVEQYVHRLRAKLAPAAVNIRTVRGLGYLLEPVDETAG